MDAAAVSAFGENIEEVVGKALPASSKDAVTMAAIGRMLRRGPALRAWSSAWPGHQAFSDVDGGWCCCLLAQSTARNPYGCARVQADDEQDIFHLACGEVNTP